MNALRYIALLPYIAIFAAGQSAPNTSGTDMVHQAETTVLKLYQQVMAGSPIGTMTTRQRRAFAPYLSRTLVRKIDLAKACEADFFRQHPQDPALPEKPPFAWMENGTFSGGDDESALRSFQLEKSKTVKDGFIDVDVLLRWEDSPPQKPWFSHVVAVVKQENRRFVVDDVIFLGEDDYPRNERLSEVLSIGCQAGHWIDTK